MRFMRGILILALVAYASAQSTPDVAGTDAHAAAAGSGNGMTPNAFSTALSKGAVASQPAQPPSVVEGNVPGAVIIDTVLPYPSEGKTDTIILRNIGSQTVNMKGWRLTNSDTAKDSKSALVFGSKPGCPHTIGPAGVLLLSTITVEQPCGFTFGLSVRDEVHLYNNKGAEVSSVAWNSVAQGASIKRTPKAPKFFALPSGSDIIEVLRAMKIFSTFIEALQAAGLTDLLLAPANPSYKVVLAAPPPPPVVTPQFPWWFGFETNRSALPPPPPPPPPSPPPLAGIPSQGPFTVLAPTDKAFDDLMTNLGGFGTPISKQMLLTLPELKDILMYHIIPGDYTSNYIFNETGYWTSQGVDVVAFKPGSKNAGYISLNDACVDKPTPDRYTCEEQLAFNACNSPFMVSPLGAQWQGGYCQRTCHRCSCEPESGVKCSNVEYPDLLAINGVAHGISRVLFPPPIFTKAAVIAAASAGGAGNASHSNATGSPTAAPLPNAPRPTADPALPAQGSGLIDASGQPIAG